MNRNEDLGNFVYGKLPPQALDLEEKVLGAIMTDATAMNAVGAILQPEDFYASHHRLIYSAARDLFVKNAPIDMSTTVEQLKKNGTLDAVGGAYHIVELTNKVASAANVEYHSKIILENSLSRMLINLCTSIIKDSYEDTSDFFTVFDNLGKQIDLVRGRIGDSTPAIPKLLDKIIQDSLFNFENKGKMVGDYFSDIDQLDEEAGGLRGNTFMAVGGRPGAGKSSLANNIITHHVKNNLPIALWSGEMSVEDGLIRLIAAVGNLDKSKIENGEYLGDEEETARYEEADSLIRNYQEDRLFMIDGNMSVNKLKSWVVVLKEKGVKTILLDRLALMDEVKAAKSTSESIGIASQVCTQFRAICNLMEVNLIMFSQLNAAIDSRTGHYPQMSDFFGATGIQAAATIALIISRPFERYGQEFFKGGRNDGQSAEGKAELVIVKNTHGKEDVAVMVDFKGSQSLFIEEKEDWTAYEEVDKTGDVKMGSKTNKLPF